MHVPHPLGAFSARLASSAALGRNTWTSLVDPITRLVYFVHNTKGVIRWTLPHSLTQRANKASSKPPLSKRPGDLHSAEEIAAIRARVRARVHEQREMVKARQAQREARTRQEWSERRKHLQRQVALVTRNRLSSDRMPAKHMDG